MGAQKVASVHRSGHFSGLSHFVRLQLDQITAVADFHVDDETRLKMKRERTILDIDDRRSQ